MLNLSSPVSIAILWQKTWRAKVHHSASLEVDLAQYRSHSDSSNDLWRPHMYSRCKPGCHYLRQPSVCNTKLHSSSYAPNAPWSNSARGAATDSYCNNELQYRDYRSYDRAENGISALQSTIILEHVVRWLAKMQSWLPEFVGNHSATL